MLMEPNQVREDVYCDVVFAKSAIYAIVLVNLTACAGFYLCLGHYREQGAVSKLKGCE